MPAVRRIPERWSSRVALAAVLACAWLCANALSSAASAQPALLTYIVGLGTGRAPQVVVSRVDGSSARTLGRATSALLSPNGTSVAAINSQDGTLSLYPAGGGAATILQSKTLNFMQLLAWSPDSKWLLVEVGSTPHAKLIVFNAVTGAPTIVADGVFDGASFDPDGSDDIVYALASNSGGSAFNLFVTTSTGSPTRQLTRDGRSELPVWGRIGIAYSRVTSRQKGEQPVLQLWLINPSGTSTRPLATVAVPPNDTGLTPIAFSANGEHLLANLVGPNEREAYVLDLSAPRSAPRDLTGGSNGTIGDAISSTGTLILATKGSLSDEASLSVEEIRWGGGKTVVIAKNGAYASWNQ